MHSKYTDLSSVARDIFSIRLQGVRVEASLSLRRDVIVSKQSRTTGGTLHGKVIVRQFPQANNRLLAGDNPVSDKMNTDNDSEMHKEAEERTLHRTAKVHDFLEMGQGSQNQCLAQKEP